MKIYFSVVGIGLGHVTRCLAVADRLEKRGFECVFSSYGKAAKLAASNGYRTYDSTPITWFQDEDGVVHFENTLLKSPLIFLRMADHFDKELKRIRKEDPDLVISDSRYSSIPASKDLGVPRMYITNQPRIMMPSDENGHKVAGHPLEKIGCWFNYRMLCGQEMILLPDFPLPYSISNRHMRFEDAPKEFCDKTRFIGPISPHRPSPEYSEGVELVCEKYGVEPGNFIYIAFSGPGFIEPDLKSAIFNLFFKNDTPAIMGTAKPGMFKTHKRGGLILVDGWIEDRCELMEAAKLVISRGGLTTLSEVTAFGKKTIVIPQGNQPEQESNAMGLENLGFAVKLMPEDITPGSLDRSIRTLENSHKAEKAAAKWKNISKKWNGEKRAEKLVVETLKTP